MVVCLNIYLILSDVWIVSEEFVYIYDISTSNVLCVRDWQFLLIKHK